MEASVMFFCVLGFLAFLAIMANAARECPRSSSNAEFMKLIPCASAAQDSNVPVSSSCCASVQQLERNPKCFCAVMLSNTVKSSGVKMEVAMSIPKWCNLADRPVGYKCGAYTLP